MDQNIETSPPVSKAQLWQQRAMIGVGILLLLGLITGIVFSISAMIGNPERTETIRDIMIVFLAVESLLIGLALIVVLVQLAQLTALIQNEVRPMLDSANEALNTMRGTTTFLSNNLVRPVTKLSSSAAAVRRVFELIGIGRR